MRQNPKLFSFSIFSSRSSHLYIILCEGLANFAFPLLRFSPRGPSLRLHPREMGWGISPSAAAPFPSPPLLELGLWPCSRPRPNSSSLHPAPDTPIPSPWLYPKGEGLGTYGACSVCYQEKPMLCSQQPCKVSTISPAYRCGNGGSEGRRLAHQAGLLTLRPGPSAPPESADPTFLLQPRGRYLVLAQQTGPTRCLTPMRAQLSGSGVRWVLLLKSLFHESQESLG